MRIDGMGERGEGGERQERARLWSTGIGGGVASLRFLGVEVLFGASGEDEGVLAGVVLRHFGGGSK